MITEIKKGDIYMENKNIKTNETDKDTNKTSNERFSSEALLNLFILDSLRKKESEDKQK